MTIPTSVPAAPTGVDSRLATEVARRRTLAIISHPDAGKTTLTEKLLLYGGAIHLAGSVKARRAARHVTSDWMELERQRGISVTSSVMAFDYNGYRINLLDTPGHQDFSEDTYRTLVAADSAVMLLDNRKGVEERTRQLFAVCKRRRMPIFTFVNKCDRAGENPLKLLSDVEAELGIDCYPVTWPVFASAGFAGVYDRRTKKVTLFERTADHGASIADTLEYDVDAPELLEIVGAEGMAQLEEEVSLLDEAGHQFSKEALLDGSMTPVHFGSALTNFGVEAFLQDFLALAPSPTARESSIGPIEPTRTEFTGFVFKIQANMDPRHRDRIAFVRLCSGHFEPGIEVKHVRTGKTLRLAAAQQLMGRERNSVEEAWAGDVIGVIDRGALRIGDTLSQAGDLEFQGIPRFPPEHFARVYPADPLRRKHLDTGLRELSEEGAAQVYYLDGASGPTPIVGAVGQLQFDVMLFRLQNEYGAPCRIEPIGFRFPRWVVGPAAAIDRAAAVGGRLRLYDTNDHPVMIFENEWSLRTVQEFEKGLTFLEVAPLRT